MKRLRLLKKLASNANLKIDVYIVGGAVRDRIMGLPVKDRDFVVVGGNEDIMLRAGYIKVGKSFPVFLDPETKEEYALARVEKKISRGYHGFEFKTEKVTLEEDLGRMDLTINAIAEDLDGNLIDPFNGVQDIESKILRHVSSAFKEDPLRVVRLGRFYSRFDGFKIADSTKEIVLELIDELPYLVKERLTIEVEKVSAQGNPYRFFKILDELKVLKYIFPNIQRFELLKGYKRIEFSDLVSILAIENGVQLISKDLRLSKKVLKKAAGIEAVYKHANSLTTIKLIKNIQDEVKRFSLDFPKILPEKRVEYILMASKMYFDFKKKYRREPNHKEEEEYIWKPVSNRY